MSLLSTVSRGLGRRWALAACQANAVINADGPQRRRGWQAAGWAAAAGSSGGDAAPAGEQQPRWRPGQPGRQGSAAAAEQPGEEGQASTLPSGPGAAVHRSRLGRLCGRFKSRAGANDALGAEHYYRAYIQAGGEPQAWMLHMLLGCYGRRREGDRVWAIYRALQSAGAGGSSSSGGGSGGGGGGGGLLAEGAAEAADSFDAAAAAAAGAATGPGQVAEAAQHEQLQQQQQPVEQQEPQHHAWEGRLERRRRQLAAWAAELVRDLRLAEHPLGAYGYSAVLTALSRAEHPPYDLPPLYARRAAAVFEDMLAAGVRPNLVLWHNLLDCQAKAGLADAAFGTYRRMRRGGAAPTPWTFSMLVSACGRARRPGRASEVIDRLMPQAGVAPSLAVWNALLGAYGRAGSVDAAYAAWVRMLDAGAVPDDCTERALALAFGSHPALAAEVVAEARQIRQQRLRAGGDGPAQQPGQEAEQQWAQEQLGSGGGGGGGGAGAEAGEAAGAQAAAAPLRLPYRLLRHRQPTLPVDRPPHSSRLSLALPWAPPLGRTGGGANVAGLVAGGAASGSGGGTAAEEAEEAEEARLQLRQLLTLDLHGSSRAAARMVLLRRLEALVLAAPELEAEVARLRRAAAHPQARLQQGSTKSGGDGGSGGGSLSFAGDAEPGEQQQQQQQQQQQREQRRLEEYPGEPPPLKVITGVGRHSRGDRGGVLRAAVRELLAQQGLPAQDDPAGNEGVVLVPWPALRAYLEQQRRDMEKDHFLSAARMRYLYVLSGVAGLAAAANLLPRLAPWLA